MRIEHVLPFLLTTACVGQAQVAEEMKEALVHTNEALAVALVSVEPASYGIDPEATLDDGYRHPALGPCPSNEHDTEDPDRFLTELDYGDGCLPRSGLLPTIVADAAALGWDRGAIEITYGGVRLALANAVEGTAFGSVEAQGTDELVRLEADVTITGERALSAVSALTALLTPDGVELDGEVHLEDGVFVGLDGVLLPYSEIRGECPSPTAGRATVGGGDVDLVVDLGDPGDGEVLVTRGRRSSDPTSLCSFDSWLFSG